MDKQPLNYYRLSPKEVMDQLHTSPSGLGNTQAGERLASGHRNQLESVHRTWAGIIFLRQFKNLLVAILLISSAFAIYLHDLKTATILIFIALVNTFVGYFQEHKAERLSESLERLIVPQAKVMRGGKLEEVNSTELVLGDVIYIESGDSVPADLRIIDEQELSTNDFALTGESNPARKFVHAMTGDVGLALRHNLVFMGTTVATGSGHGVVIATGMQTELGHIAGLSQDTRTDSSPLQREMSHLATRLTQGTAILAVILTAIALHSHLGLRNSLLFAIGISAAMIPNGLAAEVNITLAQTANKMAKAKALVKKLSAVETLGATNIICTDKTGTLTKNEMTVESMLIGRTPYLASGTGYDPSTGTITTEKQKSLDESQLEKLKLFFSTCSLASNARVEPPDSEHGTWYCVGDPTEGALITLAEKAGIDADVLEKQYPELKELQFDSARKRMSSVRQYNNKIMVFTKGAPENVLERCSHLWNNGKVRKLTKKDREYFLSANEVEAQKAMRNLAFAFSTLPKNSDPTKMEFDEIEKNLTFLGTVSMVDPLHEQVPAAMAVARKAHIIVSIITGDSPLTAKAIARKANMVPEDQEITVILGDELAKLADSQIIQIIERGGAIFSRVAPEDKLRIVELVKQHGQVVAVTGDGINDAPALKRADIGVAMGKTGTDIAKQAAEIILLDDSFDTLVGAIEQGRLTYKNITKAARSALTTNAAELGAVLIGLVSETVFHVPIAITAIQILAIDVIAQIFPVTALGWDPAQNQLMKDKPRNLHDHIINRKAVGQFVVYGFLAAGLAYGNFLLFFVRRHISPVHLSTISPIYEQATILTYLTIVLCQFSNLLVLRTDEHEPFFTKYLWSNKKLLMAFALSIFCILNIMYDPIIRPFFSAGPLALSDWLFAIMAAAIYLSIALFRRHSKKHSRKAVLELHRKVTAAQAAQ